MMLDEKQESFIRHLLSLAVEGKEDRGALADLRSGLGKEMGEMTRVHKHVVEYLPAQKDNDRWYYLIATLFGMHSKHKNPVKHEAEGRKRSEVWTMGRAFRSLREAKEKRDSLDSRFVALLNAHPDDLGEHLRHAVRLLKANDEQPLDWFQLFKDLLQWDRRGRPVQLRWAQDYYCSGRAEHPGAGTSKNERKEDIDHE